MRSSWDRMYDEMCKSLGLDPFPFSEKARKTEGYRD